jgi:hypothetical protein
MRPVTRRFGPPAAAAILAALAAACARPAPPAPPSLTFDHYHGYDETKALVDALAAAHPDLATVYSIGRDLQGYELWAIEITNTATGPASSKPAFYADGNIDADEPSSTEVILRLAYDLLAGHGEDPALTALVDTTAFYLVPTVNPYMADLYVSTPMTGIVSSINSRPRDDDGDGQADEDPPDDVDGDGRILQMRIRDPEGGFRTSPDDDRLVVPAAAGEPREWRVLTEGFDNDGDGVFNEDWIGGVDLNRNFPFDWKPEWIQEGAGPYPLSEPETRAIVDFVNAHPNIGFVISGHSGPDVGLIYRPYGSRSDEAIPEADRAAMAAFEARFAALSGGLGFEAPYGPAAIRRFGWAYEMAGAFSFSPEHGFIPGEPGPDGRVPDAELLRISDSQYGGSLFVPWTPFEHPTLGPVELGGFVKFTKPNPPPGPALERLVDVYSRMYAFWASTLPRLELPSVDVRPAGEAWLVTATVANHGALPTYVTAKALGHGYPEPVSVELILGPGVEILEGEVRRVVGHLDGIGLGAEAPGTTGPVAQTVSWRVRSTGADAWVEVSAATPKAGAVRQRVVLTAR